MTISDEHISRTKGSRESCAQVDDIHDADDDEKQQRRTEHHDHFHELAAHQASVLSPQRHDEKRVGLSPKVVLLARRNACSRQTKQARPAMTVCDEVIERSLE